jgi:uncharacterized protein
MKIGVIQMHFYLPGCTSLKEKRGRIKPLLSRLHSEFNVSVSELDLQDRWQEALVGCALISNDIRVVQKTFEKIKMFSQSFFTEIELTEERIEIL